MNGPCMSMTYAGMIPTSISGTLIMALGQHDSQPGMPPACYTETREMICRTPNQQSRICKIVSSLEGHGKFIVLVLSELKLINGHSISCQMTESYESAWYGTFKVSPDEPYPTPDSDLYPPEIYVRTDLPWKIIAS